MRVCDRWLLIILIFWPENEWLRAATFRFLLMKTLLFCYG